MTTTHITPEQIEEKRSEYLRFERDPKFQEACRGAGLGEVCSRVMFGHISFGTAGLRGKMDWGFTNLNSATIIKATQGVCGYYIGAEGHGVCQKKGVVIGYDGRYHSRYFAHLAAATFMAAEIPVFMHDDMTMTPMTPFMVKRYGAVCGIQITASHNPKDDNGYKLYGSTGSQICVPIDEEIHASILGQKGPWERTENFIRHHPHYALNISKCGSLLRDPFPDALESYKKEVCKRLSLQPFPTSSLQSCPRIVYTAMHGVGYRFVNELLGQTLNLSSILIPVEQQQYPDPEFPSVACPSPDEPSALDNAVLTANGQGAWLIIANDPDADRLAVCERRPDGTWHRFTGDELGVLLTLFALEAADRNPMTQGRKLAVVRSAVTSNMIDSILTTTRPDVAVQESLTGFKWLLKVANSQENETEGRIPVICYEEALGYAITPQEVPDKDGVSAAALLVTSYLRLHQQGMNLSSYLENMMKQTGALVATNKGYYKVLNQDSVAQCFNQIRAHYPTEIGGVRVTRIRDLGNGYDSMESERGKLPRTEMVTIYLENNVQITWRASGTESKLKFYAQAKHHDNILIAKSELRRSLAALQEYFLRPRPADFEPQVKTYNRLFAE